MIIEKIKLLIAWLWFRRTRIFGFIQVTIGYFALAENIFTKDTLQKLLFVNGLLTVWLGFFNASQIKKAKAEAEQEEGTP